MNAPIRLRVLVLTLLLAAPSLLALVGCGGQPKSGPGANDASTQSVSSYEAEIAKSKAATPRKAAK
jgi:hypothetical protein